ncbi:MAG: hypothetical protein JSS50_00185 [Proteobacteria bacterium]|nr:hypothetical protein [Pseudomonadota bacterium]
MGRIERIKQRGSALIYFGVILILGSIAVLTVAKYYGPKKDVEKQQILDQKLSKIAQAIDVFVGEQGRLPCPASPNIATGDASFGIESRDATTRECNAAGIMANTTSGNIKYMGAVPGKTLGLNELDVVDPWGNKIEYAVSYAFYKSKAESPGNNFYNTNGALQVQDGVGNTLEPVAGYILISRGQNQLGAWPATGATQIQLPANGNLERYNLGCQLNASGCNGANFGSLFISNPSIIDDKLLYRNKNGINTNCASGDTSASCNNIPCNSSQWTVGGNGTITVNTTTLPSLTIPPNILAQQGMAYSLKLRLNSLSTSNGSFQLMYEYTTTSSATLQTVQIAEFSSSSFTGQYNSSYVGQDLTVYFGASNHIPGRLYFTSTAASGSSMVMSNVFVQVAPLYYQNLLTYKIWKNICSSSSSSSGTCGGCGCCGNCGCGEENSCGKCCGIETCCCGGCGCCGNGGCGDESSCGTCCGCGSCTPCDLTNLLNNANYPNNPNYQSLIPTAQGFTSYGNNYYSMISGYFTPDETAQYTFSIAADKIAALYVSPDGNPANAVQVASRTTASAPLAWSAAGATTYTVSLTTGKSYYFHVLQMAETSGNDNLALGCAKTNSSGTTPIAVLGTGTDTVGCGGTVSTAPMLTVLNQVKCQ